MDSWVVILMTTCLHPATKSPRPKAKRKRKRPTFYYRTANEVAQAESDVAEPSGWSGPRRSRRTGHAAHGRGTSIAYICHWRLGVFRSGSKKGSAASSNSGASSSSPRSKLDSRRAGVARSRRCRSRRTRDEDVEDRHQGRGRMDITASRSMGVYGG